MNRHNPPNITLHTPYDILRSRPPPLLTQEPYQTQSSALHKSYYAKKLTEWNISEDVKRVTDEKNLCGSPLDVSVDIVSQNPCHVKGEHYLCGDEQTVCGRYSDNTLKPVTAVALQQNICIRFGDYKVCQENKDPDNKGYIPDFVGVASARDSFQNLVPNGPTYQPKMRIVGEAKTPWKHDLRGFWNRWKRSEEHQYIQQALGQIAAYMHLFKMRYGFLTTYDYTIFITQQLVRNEPVLSITPPIPAQPTSQESLSVRQYLYYLVYNANGDDFKFENPCPFNEWVIGDPKDIVLQDPMTPIAKRTVMDEHYQMTPAPTETLCRSEGWYTITGGQGGDSIRRLEDGHAPRKTAQQSPNLFGMGPESSPGQSLMDKFKGAKSRSMADAPGHPPSPLTTPRAPETEEATSRKVTKVPQKKLQQRTTCDEKTLVRHGGPPTKDDDKERKSSKMVPISRLTGR
ncbi:hypothetical protein ACJ73_05108 [Blastomyces percursus]|uniref:Uncharacterized protein n=1 Tax=Blastomyces percursus TaxID=1658174 RepID=A0A1J9R4W2_9EURO|nr:hypothetical protein ACJ73_05108 [Blastomyces percursus]